MIRKELWDLRLHQLGTTALDCVTECPNSACLAGSSREVVAPTKVAEQMVQKLRGKKEFTVLVTLKQERLNSGVILSIHHQEHR